MWSFSKLPSLAGKTFVVTGGNSGVGYEAARHLAAARAKVVIATHPQAEHGRVPQDLMSGPQAVSRIQGEHPAADVEFMELDLSSFRSIHRFVDAYKQRTLTCEALINDAGLQTPPDARTEEGFEITLGVNFFGPLLLTHLMQPILVASAPARVVWVASAEEGLAPAIDWDDIAGSKMPTTVAAYATSKLFVLMAGLALQDRLAPLGVSSLVCHPGLARTDIYRKGDHTKPTTVITEAAQAIFGQSAERGALPVVYAAAAPELEGLGGGYFGAPYLPGVTINVANTSTVSPKHPAARDPEQRSRLLDEALRIVQEMDRKHYGAWPAGSG